MGTLMSYSSTATKLVKPDKVDISISIKGIGQTAKEALDLLNESRNLVKTYITNLKSYEAESYQQNGVSLRKNVNKEYYYMDINNNTKISVEDYERLPQDTRFNYKKYYREIFLNYSANVTIQSSLLHTETAVMDLMNIINMSTEKEFICTYNHTISKNLQEQIMQDLYIKCINEGVEHVITIVKGLIFTDKKEVNLLEVRDPDVRTKDISYDGALCKGVMRNSETSFGTSYQPEQIISPELIEELFNNNMELKKTLDLKFEF